MGALFARMGPGRIRVLESHNIETTIVPDKNGGFGTLPIPLIVLCGGFPRNFVSDLETAQLSDSTHFGCSSLGETRWLS